MPPRIAVLSDAVGHADLEGALAAIAAAGGDGVEITVGPGGHLDATRPDVARSTEALVARAGLVTCGLAATGALPVGAAGLRPVVELAAALGLPFVRVFAPAWSETDGLDEQLLATAAAMADLAVTGHGDVRVLVELAEGTLVPSPELARRLLAGGGPAVGVVYDPANMVAEGHLQPSLALAVLGGLLGHVHVKNRVFDRRDGTWETGYATLRDGLVDWPRTVRALDAAGYDGWLTIDHLSDGPSALRRDVEELRGMVAPPAPRPDRRPIDRPRQRGRP